MSQRHVFVVLGIGVVAVSMAALLVRLAQAEGAPSLVIAAGRLLLAALVVVPLALARHAREFRAMTSQVWFRCTSLGFLLASHFALWIASLTLTSVAASTALASTTSIWTALAAWIIFRERLRNRQWLGLAIAVGGSLAFVFAGRVEVASEPTTARAGQGALLAVGSAWAMAAYLLVGTALRRQMPTLAFVALTYGFAALWLLVGLFTLNLGFANLSSTAWLAIALLALIPQLIGHTALNYALPKLGATSVSVSVLAEPVAAAVLAGIYLGEHLSGTAWMCFAAILCGIAMVVTPSRAKT